MRKLLLPLAVCIPALAVFALIHWPVPGSMSASWWQHYASYSGHGTDPELNPLFRITTLPGGWGTFWRDAWACWGVVWILALFAWPRSRLLWKVMFIVLFIGCFVACMVSYDKGRLWIRMAPVLLPMVVEWIAMQTRARLYVLAGNATYEVSPDIMESLRGKLIDPPALDKTAAVERELERAREANRGDEPRGIDNALAYECWKPNIGDFDRAAALGRAMDRAFPLGKKAKMKDGDTRE